MYILSAVSDLTSNPTVAWIVAIVGPGLTIVYQLLITKLRAKVSMLAAKDEQIAEQSLSIINLTIKLEALAQMFSIAFLESKGLSPESKVAIANLAQDIVKDTKTEAGKLITTALNRGKDAINQETQKLIDQAAAKASDFISQLTSSIPNVDELT